MPLRPQDGLLIDASGNAHFNVLIIGRSGAMTTLASLLAIWNADRGFLPHLGKQTPVVLCLSGSKPPVEDVPEGLSVVRADCQVEPRAAFEKLLSELGIEPDGGAAAAAPAAP